MNTQRLVDTFLKYVQIDSESFSELNMAKAVISDLEELGFSVYMDDCGKEIGSNAGNVYATLKGDENREPILFSAHMDTVKPGIGVKPVIADGVIRSDGTTILGGDDKSGITAVIEAMRMVKEQNISHPDIEIVFTVCEEQGLLGSRHLDYSRITAKKAVVLDSSGDAGKIITSAPGQVKIDGCFVGRSAHAGIAPEKGISAIQIAAEAVSNMKLLR
ncbi:MAG: M20/M25/M40 family metallo-hydrolase, partial [Oscillospiraceae bacterium]|nr:M20/M25/M40 family metallo-hydrolase [Oscillospiraceae bacterium]